jgi:ABC-type transport system substrate-binding protein
MAINRKSLIGPMTNGEGEPEGLMSIGSAWKFRKPAELKSAKNFEYNVAEAKKLLSAAGVSLPIKVGEVPTWNPTVIGPEIVDGLTLVVTGWKNDGIADASIKEETFGQFVPRLVGTYDFGMWGPNTQATGPDLGNSLKNKYFWPIDATEKPVLNSSWVKNAELNTLLDKQMQEFDKNARQAVLTQIEDLVNEEMFHISSIEGRQNYFGDPSLRNAQMPRDAFNGGFPWFKYWWFDKT